MAAVSVTSIVKIKKQHAVAFEKMSLAHAKRSIRNEPGCLAFEVSRDDKKPGRFVIYEVFTDAEAYAAHHQTASTRKIVEALGRGWIESRGQVIGPIERVAAPNK
jgi:quinol monooxygenase YgiN